MDRQFEWDENKNSINIEKHGISFEIAKKTFNDPFRIEILDILHSTNEEERYQSIGMAYKILFVVFTKRNDLTRIISARLANKKETEVYNDGLFNTTF